MSPLTRHTLPASKRISELDGLRGLAIALVLWHHLVDPFLPLGAAHWLGWVQVAGNLAWAGVDLFFVLSGFFIGGILIDHRESPRLNRVFYLRRALRILPLFFVTLVVALALARAGWGVAEPDLAPWVYGLFLSNIALALQNKWEAFQMSLLWSLAVEEQFYLIAPLVVRAVAPARLPALLLGLILSAMLLRAGLKWHNPDLRVAIHVLTPLRMDALAWGALVAWAVRAPAAQPLFQRLRTTWLGWLFCCATLLIALTANRAPVGTAMQAYLGYTIISISFALLVAVVVTVQPRRLNQFLALPALAHLGRHSYFVYLWHVMIGLNLIKWLGGPDFVLNSPTGLLVVFGGIGATWLAAVLSWRYFESPLLKLGHRTGY